MTTMLERAARALALSYYEDDRADNPSAYISKTPAQMVEWSWDQWVPQVRAVLMAVREPGREAVNAGVKAGHAASGLPDILHVPSAYTAMIDAILDDG